MAYCFSRFLEFTQPAKGSLKETVKGAKRSSSETQAQAASLLADLTYELWEKWREDPKNTEWQGMEIVVLNGDFHFDLMYSDQLAADEDFDDRREAFF